MLKPMIVAVFNLSIAHCWRLYVDLEIKNNNQIDLIFYILHVHVLVRKDMDVNKH